MSRERVSPTPMIDALLSGRVGFSIEELASAMGVSRDTIEREIQRGTLKTFRVGQRRRVTVDSIRQMVARSA